MLSDCGVFSNITYRRNDSIIMFRRQHTPTVVFIVQFTMSRIIVSFTFLGDLQNYTFLESLEPTEPEK